MIYFHFYKNIYNYIAIFDKVIETAKNKKHL